MKRLAVLSLVLAMSSLAEVPDWTQTTIRPEHAANAFYSYKQYRPVHATNNRRELRCALEGMRSHDLVVSRVGLNGDASVFLGDRHYAIGWYLIGGNRRSANYALMEAHEAAATIYGGVTFASYINYFFARQSIARDEMPHDEGGDVDMATTAALINSTIRYYRDNQWSPAGNVTTNLPVILINNEACIIR